MVSALLGHQYGSGKAREHLNHCYEFILNYYSEDGRVNYPLPQADVLLSRAQYAAVLIQSFVAELFVVCHELAHIILDHVDDKRVKRFTIGPSSASTLPVYNHKQYQEFDADRLGYAIYRDVVKNTEASGSLPDINLFTECFCFFQLLHLVERNLDRFRDMTTHPPAKDRLVHLIAIIHCELEEQGINLLQDPLYKQALWHTKLLKGVAGYPYPLKT
jgi:hypothetical protein